MTSGERDFEGRVAIVTGAACGLGRPVAARLHERGASVVVNVRDQARAATAADALGTARSVLPAMSPSRVFPKRLRVAPSNASAGSTS
jgi:NAD(P)-dependent dehydrogenase (short-subunit alcohol dehydrogenase family)